MPDYVNLWHAVDDPTYQYSWATWDGNGNVTLAPEAIDNAWAAWYRYKSKGWSDAAIAAVVGMQVWECGLNPWRWQSNRILASNSSLRYTATDRGYGLPQFTPQAVYSDPVTYYRNQGLTSTYQYVIDFFINDADFRASFAPHYSDVQGRASDGDAQCNFIDCQCSGGSAIYFRRRRNGSPMYYTYGYMPFADFKTAVLNQTYTQSPDTSTDAQYPTYTITLESLIYQWLNNYGRGATETTISTAVRLSAATQLYTLYTGNPPPTPPTPPTPTPTRSKMPLWMMLRQVKPFAH